jgi:hypothetical protein
MERAREEREIEMQTKKQKVSDLQGALLDAAVAIAEGLPFHPNPGRYMTHESQHAIWAHERQFSSRWDHGGPIIERMQITICGPDLMTSGLWEAFIEPVCRPISSSHMEITGRHERSGPTPLIAAMRVYVASRLGEEVELPWHDAKAADESARPVPHG